MEENRLLEKEILYTLLEEIKSLKEESKNLKEEIKNLKNNNGLRINKTLKKEIFNKDVEFLLKILEYQDHRTEIEFFKEYYFEECPIKVISERKIKIHTKKGWIDDYNGYRTTEILCSNIYRSLLSVNNNDYIDDSNQFLSNQMYLNKFLDPKYCRNVFNKIKIFIVDHENE